MIGNNKNLKFSYSNGFSIIEVVVTVAVFSIAAILIVSIFARAVALERRAVSAEKLQSNGTFIIESMAKEIRVSTIENQESLNNCATPLTTLTMTHPQNGVITYSLNNGSVRKMMGYMSNVNSSDVIVTRLNFCVNGSDIYDNESPRVTVILSMENSSGEILDVNLQTTIVSRNISSELQN